MLACTTVNCTRQAEGDYNGRKIHKRGRQAYGAT